MNSETNELPCTDKLAFDTLKQAQAAANVAAFQRGVKVRPYFCRHCDLWHLSSQ